MGRKIYFSAIAMGSIAALLSGSRGSWLAILAAVFATIFFYTERYSVTKRIAISIMAIVCVMLASSAIPQVKHRVDLMFNYLSPYVKNEEQSEFNSLRYRIESWRAAFRMGMDSPIVGIGPGNFRSSLEDYVEQYPHLESLQIMKHAHNQYMQTFATTGVPGLIALLALFLAHASLFARYLASKYPLEVRSYALAGLLLVTSFSLLSITGVPFERKKQILFYGFTSASFWGCLLGALRQFRQNETAAVS